MQYSNRLKAIYTEYDPLTTSMESVSRTYGMKMQKADTKLSLVWFSKVQVGDNDVLISSPLFLWRLVAGSFSNKLYVAFSLLYVVVLS